MSLIMKEFIFDFLITNLEFSDLLHKKCDSLFGSNFSHISKIDPYIDEFSGVALGNTKVQIFFNSLSESDEILLNDLIFNYDFNAKLPVFLLSGNSNINELSNINHDRKSLQVKNIYIDGLLKEINYWQSYDKNTNTYSGLTVKEVRTFYTNVFTGYTHSRSLNIYYYLDNGQIGYSILNQMKYYINIDEQDKNLRERRTIVLAEAKKWLLESYLIPNYGLIALQYAKDFLSELTQAMEKYINGVHTDLQNAINNTTLSFIIPEVKNQLQLLITYQNLEVV